MLTFDPRNAFITCPRGCDVATLPEPVQNRPGRYACTACGYEFEGLASRAGNVERDPAQTSQGRRLLVCLLLSLAGPAWAQTPLNCTVTGTPGPYADGDVRRTIRCDTNGPVATLPTGTRFTLALPTPAPSTALVPAERLAVANWRASGMLQHGGIPVRNTICAAVLPTGGDDTAAIQAALDACPLGQVVQLEARRYDVRGFLLMSRGVTLRGRGPETIVEKSNGAVMDQLAVEDSNPLIVVGPHRWPHWVNPGRDLSANAVQGQTTITLADTSGLVVGQHVEVGEDQFFTGAWRDLPPVAGVPNLWQQWAGDRISWPRYRRKDGSPEARPWDYYGPGIIAPDSGPLTWHCRGYGYCLNEIKEIASIVGNVVTFTTPLTTTYRLSHKAQLAVSDSPFVRGIGIESMTLLRGGRGAINFGNAAQSWVADVTIKGWAGRGLDISQSRQIEVVRTTIEDTAWAYPGGGGYGLVLQNGSTEILVWQSTMRRANKAMVANAAGAGSVIAYNLVDDTYIASIPGWQEVGLNGSHFGGSHHMLFEGNHAPNFDSDDTHGTSWAHTVLRNTLTGRRSSFSDTSNARALGLMFGSRDMTFLGNTLGTTTTGWVRQDGPAFDPSRKAVYRLGYAPGEWGMAADPVVTSTLIEFGNTDPFGVRTPAPSSIPASYFLDRPLPVRTQ